MKTYFKTRVKTTIQDDEGRDKRVMQTYVIKADDYTMAETGTRRLMKEHFSDFSIESVVKFNVTDVQERDLDYYYKVKIEYSSLDAISGKAQSLKDTLVVNADNFTGALETCINDSSLPSGFLFKSCEQTDIVAYLGEVDSK